MPCAFAMTARYPLQVPQDMMGVPVLPHHPLDPPRHLPGETWTAEPRQAQPSRRVTQAAAKPGDGTGRDISAGWPLHKLGLQEHYRQGWPLRASPRQDRRQPRPAASFLFHSTSCL